jgi:hypothetical protein
VIGLGNQRVKRVFTHQAQTPQPVSMAQWQYNCICCFTEPYRFRECTRSVYWDMPSIFPWCISSHQYKSWGTARSRSRGGPSRNNISRRNKGWIWGELCLCVLIRRISQIWVSLILQTLELWTLLQEITYIHKK